ncbi:MAG: pentapeptide repeat-containing protein [Gammaproteobacteria bacterium]
MSAERSPVTQARLWFVRRGSTVKGPYPTVALRRNLMLGRLALTDEISHDREHWVTMASEPSFATGPAEAVAGTSAAAVAALDERSGADRRQPAAAGAAVERRANDRRRPEPEDIVARRQRRRRVLESLAPRRENLLAPTIAIIAVIGVVVAVALTLRNEVQSPRADCGTAAAPGVRWDGCAVGDRSLAGADLRGAVLHSVRGSGAVLTRARLDAADLSYAELTRARLDGAVLTGARMRGATLQAADLADADLSGADLSYADLRGALLPGVRLGGARLDHAYWTDGRICGPQSVGTCR